MDHVSTFDHHHCVVISGCSGSGKSTLLEVLARRGHAVVPEAGRRVVQQELAAGGKALPWVDLGMFLQQVLALAVDDFMAHRHAPHLVFFDRSVVDAVAGLEHLGIAAGMAAVDCRYHATVFLSPPWPEIYVADAERRHDFATAKAEYERLCAVYPRLGYRVVTLPQCDAGARADWLLEVLANPTLRPMR